MLRNVVFILGVVLCLVKVLGFCLFRKRGECILEYFSGLLIVKI